MKIWKNSHCRVKLMIGILVLWCPLQSHSEVFHLDQNDRMEQLLMATAEQISTLKVKFKYSTSGDVVYLNVLVDIPGKRMNAMKTFPAQEGREPFVCVAVTDGKRKWQAYTDPENDGAKWKVYYVPQGEWRLPPNSREIDFGIDFIKRMVIPYTIRQKEFFNGELPTGCRGVIEQKKNVAGNTVRSYRVYRGTSMLADISYTMDMSDGMRILSVEHSVLVGEKMVIGYRATFSDHRKINDVWIPFHMREAEFVAPGEEGKPNEAWVKMADVNPIVGDDAFVYRPPFGSSVNNAATGIDERVGKSAVLESVVGGKALSTSSDVK